MPRRPFTPRIVAQLALLLAAALWGTSFLATKVGMADAGPFSFVALRFAAASLVLLLFAPQAFRLITRAELTVGVIVAALAMGGYATQALALQTVPSARVAFLSALYVPLVPVLQFVLFRERTAPMTWMGMAVGVAGVGIMSGLVSQTMVLARADILSLASAVAIALEVVILGRLVSRGDPLRIALVTLAVTAIIAAAIALGTREPMPRPTLTLTVIVAAFGAATAYIQFAMSWGQRLVSSSRAALIYSLEPVFGGLVGYAAGEALHTSDLIGGALIVVGVVAASMPRRTVDRRVFEKVRSSRRLIAARVRSTWAARSIGYEGVA